MKYCCRNCRGRHWDEGHKKECVEMIPIELQAANLARSWLVNSVDAKSAQDFCFREPMPLKWHSVEQELTARFVEQDWAKVLRMEREAIVAAEALVHTWPEVTLGIFNMLSDCYKALTQYDKALELLRRCETVAKDNDNREMEAKLLSDTADLYYHSLHNVHKATDYLKLSLAAWNDAGIKMGQGRTLTKLGDFCCEQHLYAEALGHYDGALAIARTSQDMAWEVEIEKQMCKCNAKLQNIDRAVELGKAQSRRLRLLLVDFNRTKQSHKSSLLTDRPRTAGMTYVKRSL